uniref:Carboxylic ester hydrolase n=1 Tax=Adoxophyes honmai TaxID=85585 RepID=A0A0G4DCW7_ADOHO|nr:juvenile hormone esterase [Adoxophyes honmai]
MVFCASSVAAFALLYAAWSAAAMEDSCAARVRTEAGWVCGACAPGGDYASFLGVPYAKQPLGELRFQELQPAEPWDGCHDASQPGPVCPQRDLFYGATRRPGLGREACIHANVHAPLQQLPGAGAAGCARSPRALLPVLVYAHGGGFGFGSGDPDLHGPQYLMGDNVVVVTFNYRIGPFGFLSLNSSSVPGNAGLRDMVTLLRWVQRNIKNFGGDPDDVTLAGQSAGAAAVHALTLSEAAQGLFKRVILMSGTSTRSFYSSSPLYAQLVAQMFLKQLGINATDPEEQHRRLIATPLEKIMDAHRVLQDIFGLTAFVPVVESPHPGVETILGDDPEVLQSQGRGKDIPFIIGFTNNECQTFRPRFEEIDIMSRIVDQPLVVMPPSATYVTPPAEVPEKIGKIVQRYFNGAPNLNKFIKLCSDSYFVYPALKLAEMRAANDGAPVYLYRFAYEPDYSVFQEALRLKYRGAGHSEDLTLIFRANYVLGDRTLSPRDRKMTDVMTTYVTNFMRHSNPTNGVAGWPPVSSKLQYQNIITPDLITTEVSRDLRSMMTFFDSIYSNSS